VSLGEDGDLLEHLDLVFLRLHVNLLLGLSSGEVPTVMVDLELDLLL